MNHKPAKTTYAHYIGSEKPLDCGCSSYLTYRDIMVDDTSCSLCNKARSHLILDEFEKWSLSTKKMSLNLFKVSLIGKEVRLSR